MNLLLTVYATPAWKTFTNVCPLSLVSEPAAIRQDQGAALLEPVLPPSSIPSIVINSTRLYWLAVVQAEHYLASALENEITLESAAKQWYEITTAVLNLQRQHRRQLKLFNLQQALENPDAFRDQLKPEFSITEFSPQSASSNLALLAACQYVAQRDDLKKLNAIVQATAIPICEDQSVCIDIDCVLQSYIELETQTSKLVKERDQILLHLQEAQEQLGEFIVAATERDSQLKDALAENEQLKNTIQAEEQKTKHSIIAHEKQQAREIAKLEKELRKAKAKLEAAERTNRLCKEELEKIQGSTLWKATGPVRMLSRIVKKDNKQSEKTRQDIALLLTSEYFDVEWYLKNYPDVAESNMNPAEHYLMYGAAEGRLPGPRFDGNWYSQHYPDVAAAGVNPLLHFIMFGQQEGRDSSPKLLTNNSQPNED